MTTRVLLIINRLEDNGGAEVSTGLLLDALQGRGYDFFVVTLFGPAAFAARERLEDRGAQFVDVSGPLRFRMKGIAAAADQFQPHVVHATLFDSEILGQYVAASRGVPMLVSCVSTQFSEAAATAAPSLAKFRVARAIHRLQLRYLVSHVHAISESVAAQEKALLGVRGPEMTIVPRGRPTPTPAPGARVSIRRELGIDSGAFMLLNVARQEPPKGQDLLLAAFAELQPRVPDSVLVVAGREGRATPKLRQLTKQYGLEGSVRFLGVRRDIADLHAAADVFAFSSRWEGLGGAVLEALASGTPVVAFAIPAVSEVTGTAARMVEPFDIEAFALQLEWVRDHPSEAERLAVRGAERFAERYSLESFISGMGSLYGHVRSMPPPRAAAAWRFLRWSRGPK